METISDFEDLLSLLSRHEVRYLIIGGLAFTFHAMPRYTKDMDLWIDPARENVDRLNRALEEFGSPEVLDPNQADEILQLGVAPNRIDLIRRTGIEFAEAWADRVTSKYGAATAHWIDLEGLIRIKRSIDHPRHQEDARILELVRDRRSGDES